MKTAIKTTTKKTIKRTSLFILSIALSSSALATASPPNDCLTDEVDFFNYERRVLSEVHKPGFSKLTREGRRALKCVFNFYLQSNGLMKSIAGELVSPFLGEPLPKKLRTKKPGDKHSDRQYKNVAESLERDLLATDAIFEDDLYQIISDSHWSIYAQFCKPGLESICTGFLYDNNAILAQPPLVAAVSVSNLLRASAKVPDADRAKLHRQLLDLNQTLPKEKELLKKVVQEALDRFPVLMKRMGMVFT